MHWDPNETVERTLELVVCPNPEGLVDEVIEAAENTKFSMMNYTQARHKIKQDDYTK